MGDSPITDEMMNGRYERISSDRFNELHALYRDGDQSALQKMCDANYGLVIKVVSHYWSRWHARMGPCSKDDLFQAGCAGLVRAINGFDPSLGWKFSTYATNWIRNYVQRETYRCIGAIRIPEHVINSVIMERESISDRFDMSTSVMSLNYSGEGEELGSMIGEDDTMESSAIDSEFWDRVDRICTPREAYILRSTMNGVPVKQIAVDIGVTSQQIYNIQKKAMLRVLDEDTRWRLMNRS